MPAPRELRFPSIDGLRAFDAAARVGSFERAAEELDITASAVSKRLGTLESLLGAALFTRSGRALLLTASGREYLPQVRSALALLASMPQHRRTSQRVQRLRVSAPPTFARRVLVPALGSFTQALPEVELELLLSIPYLDVQPGESDVEVHAGEPPVGARRLLDESVLPMAQPQVAAGIGATKDLAGEMLLRTPIQPWLPWLRAAGLDRGDTAMTVITHRRPARAGAKRVPRMFYDYADSGSWTESTYRANESDFQKIKLRQRVAVNMENRSTAAKMVGIDVKMPVAIAPVGLTGMQHADGEILAARAAEKFGIRFTLSTMSICSIEDVAAATTQPFWFQLYVMRDRSFIEGLIDRAKAAKCDALVLTLDLQILGQRHKDLKNGLSAPPKLTLANIVNMMPPSRAGAWACWARRGAQFGNIVGHVKGVGDMGSLSEWTAKQFDPRLNWGDVEWIKKRWGGKLILKGIQDVEDARLAVDSGADALIVSNHGGRQLDGAQSSIEALPAIVAEVGSKIEVHMDGGIRSGQDVLKAWALGARGTYIGRAMVYGLGAMGEAGVTRRWRSSTRSST
jgi:L-lactate dehydrogenase (cytochrome)